MDCHDLAAILHSVDFISRTGDSVVFRTCPEETGKVVFQIGTADAVLALKAAETVCVVGEGCNSIEIWVQQPFACVEIVCFAVHATSRLWILTWAAPSTFPYRVGWVQRCCGNPKLRAM